MRLAVIQHALRGAAGDDAAAMLTSLAAAADGGADLVVVPELPELHDDAALLADFDERAAALCGARLLPYGGRGHEGAAFIANGADMIVGLGDVAVLVGDAVLDEEHWRAALEAGCSALVLCPRSESDLQAEAILELALAFSDSVAGLVVVAECDGAPDGSPGHGGSAIISVGDVVAEAMSGEEVLFTDVALPVAQPEPRDGLPQLPTLLAQRRAHHAGSRLAVDYFADLSDGPAAAPAAGLE